MKSILLVLTSSYLASCLPPPHPAVVAVKRDEEQLPFHLRSRALWNPHLQEVLPISSLLHDGENPVFERAADNVSRQEIYNILTHAGLLPRRHPNLQPDPNHQQHQRHKAGHHHNNHQPGPQHQPRHLDQIFLQPYQPYLGNPEFLQYL